jgi:hypothetical protein
LLPSRNRPRIIQVIALMKSAIPLILERFNLKRRRFSMKARQRRWSASLRARFFRRRASRAVHPEAGAERRVPPRTPRGRSPTHRGYTLIWIALWWAIVLSPSTAQEVPLSNPGVTKPGAENLGETLFLSEPARSSQTEIAAPVDEAVSPMTGEKAPGKARWRVEPHLQVKGTYNDNIFIQQFAPVSDYVFTFAPGLGLGFWNSNEARERFLNYRRGLTVADRSEGSFVAIDYTAFLLGFAKTSSLNTVNHDARFDARWEGEKLKVGASFRYEAKLETDPDPGRLLTTETLSAAIASRYQLTHKTGLEVGMYHETNRPEGYVNTTEWRGEGFIDYAASSRVRFGFGTAGGLLEVDSGSDQVFERFLARATYSLSDKLEAEFRGGVEFRQSVQPGDRSYPIFDFRARWTPAVGTRIGIHAFRNVNKSIYEPDRDYTLTGFALTFERAILGRLLFSAEGGYHLANYIGDTRSDDYFFISPGLSYALGTWGSIGVSYQYQQNDSNRAGSSFENNQVTLEAIFTF